MVQQKDIQRRKRELVTQIGALRSDLAASRSEISKQLNPARRIGSSLQKRPLRIFGLTFILTGLLTILFRRKSKPPKTEKKKLSAKGFLTSTLLGVAQPFVKKWLIHTLERRYGDRFNLTSRDSLLGP